jgi:hypothetical protein
VPEAPSKVLLKRHKLYQELQTVVVAIDQSSTLQVLEDFLRNNIRSLSQVRSLKQVDFGAQPGRGLLGAIHQKFLKKNLSNGARKLLDKGNSRLSALLQGALGRADQAEMEGEDSGDYGLEQEK